MWNYWKHDAKAVYKCTIKIYDNSSLTFQMLRSVIIPVLPACLS